MKLQVITACAFIFNKNRVLIAKRSETKKFLPGKFELPGGHIEFGETVEEGLKREIKEEFKIDIKVGNPFCVFTYLSQNKTKHSIEIDFFAKLESPNKKILINKEDHSEVRWITEKEINKYFVQNDDERLAVKTGFKILKNFPNYAEA